MRKKIAIINLMTALCLCLASCDKDNENYKDSESGSSNIMEIDVDQDLDYQSLTLKEGDMIQVHDLDIDAKPLYKLNFRFGIKGGQLVVEGLTSHPEFPNPPAYLSDPSTAASIVDYGVVEGLSMVKKLPDSAAFEPFGNPVTQVIPQKRHGYVIKSWGYTDFSTYGVLYEMGYTDPQPIYVRLWIKNIDNGKYEIRHEVPWKS